MQDKFRFNQNIASSPFMLIVSDGGSIKKAKRNFFEISCKASGYPIYHDSPKTSEAFGKEASSPSHTTN